MTDELEAAKNALGQAWLKDGATLAEGITAKCQWLERMTFDVSGWSPQVLARITKHGAFVITIDGASAAALFREQVDGCCIEHELLSDDGETSMPVAEAIRVCDELVEDLDAGRMFDRSWGRRRDG